MNFSSTFSIQRSIWLTILCLFLAFSLLGQVPSNCNSAPTAYDDVSASELDTPVAINVLANDFDPDGNIDPSSVTVTDPPSNGTQTVDPDGMITYTPDPNYSGTDTFSYTVCDDGPPLPSLCDEATVTIFVDDNNNNPPTATDDFASSEVDVPVTISVLDNDNDPDGNIDISSLTVTDPPSNGTATINPNGTITYTPDGGFGGIDTFSYEVCDDGTPLPPECDEAKVWVFMKGGSVMTIIPLDPSTICINPSPDTFVVNHNGCMYDVYITKAPTKGCAILESTSGNPLVPDEIFNYSYSGTAFQNDDFYYKVCPASNCGNLFLDACGCTQPILASPQPPGGIPTLSQWSLLLLCLLLLSLGLTGVYARGQQMTVSQFLRAFPWAACRLVVLRWGIPMFCTGLLVIFAGWGAVTGLDVLGLLLGSFLLVYLVALTSKNRSFAPPESVQL